MAEGQHWQIARFNFEGCDFHALSYFILVPSMSRKVWMLAFNAIRITSFWPLELMLCTKHRLKVKSVNYLQVTSFYIFHPKVPSKHISFLNNNMWFVYNIRKITSLLLTFCEHKVYSYFWWNQFFYLPSKLDIPILKACIDICTLPFMLVFLLKTHLDPLSFIPSGESTKYIKSILQIISWNKYYILLPSNW
jgi:hypothetical protein